MQEIAESSNGRDYRAGRLTIAGSGITAIAQMTQETIGYLKSADIVFYNANSGVTAAYLRELNRNVVDLYEYYDEEKNRNITYTQMAELLLREVRRGRSVVGLLHGHPGFYVKAARRALAIADMEGHETRLLPGISAVDCLLADLRIDPGVIGIQILKASHLLSQEASVAIDNHVLLIQIGSVGDNTFSFTGFKHAKIERLFEELISIYGEEQDSVYYVASIFPGLDPIITVRKLGEYRAEEVRNTVHAAILYLPPAGIPFAALTNLQAFENQDPYGKLELKAIGELSSHKTPEGFIRRGASKAMLRAMMELGSNEAAARTYRKRPTEFAAGHRGLSREERDALISRETGRLRSVTTLKGAEAEKDEPKVTRHVEHTGEKAVGPAEHRELGRNRHDVEASAKRENVTLEAYAVRDNPQPLVPAPPTRDWMEAGRHAYRCLPLAAANTYGWQLLLPVSVTAEWNGGAELDDLRVECEVPYQAVSNFKQGILTFDVGYIFRTSLRYHLLVTGPSNVAKDGIAPMTAVIETDWLPYTFTFNYRFTRPGRVQWQAGEPFAQICVVPGTLQESIQPVIRSLRDDPQLEADHASWRVRRTDLRARLSAGDPATLRTPWDKDYFLGRYAEGQRTYAEHTIKARMRAPVDERRRVPAPTPDG